MLEDMTKMKANHLAILKNKSEMITNKVILDVDTGTRVLAVWAAKAGAKRLDRGAVCCDEVSIVSPFKVRLVWRDNA